jgi:TetR/AcrR family transcriptional regulator, cholesterol catabolism regulator
MTRIHDSDDVIRMTRMAGQMTDDFELPPADPLPIGGTALQCRLGEAAIDLFYAHGALATTVREITAACGLTPGALYNHFASKDYLLYVLVRDIHLLVNEQMDEALAVAGTEPDYQLAAMVRFLVAHTAGYKKRSRMANREFTVLTGERREEVRGLRRQIRDRFSAILLAGAEQGVFDLAGGNDASSAMLASATISTMCVHISEWTLEHNPTDIADLQDRYVTMALRIAGVKS